MTARRALFGLGVAAVATAFAFGLAGATLAQIGNGPAQHTHLSASIDGSRS